MSRATEQAEAFVRGLLLRELALRGDREDGARLAQLLRVVPSREELLPGEGASQGTVRVHLDLFQHLTDAAIELDAETGELTAWFLDFLADEGTRALPEAEALTLATEVARPPRDAELSHAGYETSGGRTLYRARWIHRAGGLLVEGDFLEVLINGACARAFSFTRRWRTPHLG